MEERVCFIAVKVESAVNDFSKSLTSLFQRTMQFFSLFFSFSPWRAFSKKASDIQEPEEGSLEERIDSLAYQSFSPSSLLQPSENEFDEVEEPRDQASIEQADLAKRRVIHLLGKTLPQKSDSEEIEELDLVIDYFQKQEQQQEQLPFDREILEELE